MFHLHGVLLSSWFTEKYVHLGGLVFTNLHAYSQPIGIDWDGRNCNYFVGANAHIWMWLFQRSRFGWWSFLFIWWKQKSDYQALLGLTSIAGKCKYSKELRGKEFHALEIIYETGGPFWEPALRLCRMKTNGSLNFDFIYQHHLGFFLGLFFNRNHDKFSCPCNLCINEYVI